MEQHLWKGDLQSPTGTGVCHSITRVPAFEKRLSIAGHLDIYFAGSRGIIIFAENNLYQR